jgi:hypothetical protein
MNTNIHFITFGDDNFKKSRERICQEAKNTNWFNTVKYYTNNDYDLNFYNKNKKILNNEIGGGFWIWKPYFIKQKMDEINDGDYLIYLDSGFTINKNGYERFKQYIEIVTCNDNGIIGFQYTNNFFQEKNWNINEIFDYFNVTNNTDIINTPQICAGIQIIQKKPKSIEIINKWYNVINDNILLFTNHYNNNQDISYFKDNRHDQSIQSVIKKIYKVPIIYATEIEPNHNFPFHSSRIRE